VDGLGRGQTVYKSIATWNPWTGLWKSDQLHMVLLRVRAGGAWKLQPGELESFKKGSLKASKRGAWKLQKGEFGGSDFQRGVLEFQV